MKNNSVSPSPLLCLHDTSLVISNQTIISNIDLEIYADDHLCLIGPNGAGKSTLVKIILGLMKPTSGKVCRHSKLKIGYVPQNFTVPTILPLRVIDLLKQASKNRLTKVQIKTIYERLFLTELLQRQVVSLSGGEKQRVLLARALLEKPNLLILDEPMQGLDPESEKLLYEFIDTLPDFLHCAMLVVSHDLHWVMRGSRKVICLNQKICCQGKPVEIESLAEFHKLFVGDEANTKYQYERPYIHHHSLVAPQNCDDGCKHETKCNMNTESIIKKEEAL